MKFFRLVVLASGLIIFHACSPKESDGKPGREALEHLLRKLSQSMTEAERRDDLIFFLQYYDDHAISMPEYQLTLNGRAAVEGFYKEIFARQDIKSFHREAEEFIHMNNTIVEIGTFQKKFTDTKSDSLVTLNGKYWTIWNVEADSSFQLKGECFGYFHPVEHPEMLTVSGSKGQPDERDMLTQNKIPFELRAYNALMEKGVRNRDGIMRAEMFTEDGRFYPFADSTVIGMDQLMPYMKAYNHGEVSIDSIRCYTYGFEDHDKYLLEYDMFKVKWTYGKFSGRTEGKGIRIWQRQPDHSLRLYREIGTHNHSE